MMHSLLSEKGSAEAEGLRANGEPNLVDLATRISSLILSFKGIGRIENMIGFDNLTKLCMDNNTIEDMSPIRTLVKLRWLDLSFNKIRKIQGKLPCPVDRMYICMKCTHAQPLISAFQTDL